MMKLLTRIVVHHTIFQEGNIDMNDLDVRIVRLEKMRVASVLGFGQNPEPDGWDKLEAWAKPKGFLNNPEKNRIFGFNNPDPSPGSPNYGYEWWIEVGSDVTADGEVTIKSFNGGLYAVTRCVVPKNQADPVIGNTWKQLVTWREDSKYKPGHHQWLEKTVQFESPDLEFILDLFIPIAE